MTPHPLSVWDQVQLVLLRGFSLVLGGVDRVLGLRWGERLLDHMARGWQEQLDRVNANLDHLEQERLQLHRQMDAMALQAAALHLGGRSLARHELRFDPADPQDERILDASINLLVKQHLAAIEEEEVGAGHYVYHLEPDWPAIRAELASAAEIAAPEIADWLREGVQYIDGSFPNTPQTSQGSKNGEV